MARTRRTGGSRSKKKARGWLWLVAGLMLGAAVMYGVQHFVYKDSKPFASLARLFSPAKQGTEFYTILPGETLLPEPRPDKDRKTTRTETTEKGASYVLQAAAYARAEDADRLKAKLALNGLEAHIEQVTVGDKGTHYRVRLGPYSSIEALDAANAQLSKLGIRAMRLKVRKSPRG